MRMLGQEWDVKKLSERSYRLTQQKPAPKALPRVLQVDAHGVHECLREGEGTGMPVETIDCGPTRLELVEKHLAAAEVTQPKPK